MGPALPARRLQPWAGTARSALRQHLRQPHPSGQGRLARLGGKGRGRRLAGIRVGAGSLEAPPQVQPLFLYSTGSSVMSNETQFIDGLIVKAPNNGAPDYVKAKLSIRREELIGWLQSQDGDWINVEVKESKGGKWYAAVDTWKPEQGGGSGGDRKST